MRKIRAGFVGFGEVNTPREIIERKCGESRRLLEEAGLELSATAPVRDDPAGAEVARACAELARADFDMLILCVAGWIPSHAVIAVADAFRHKPMVLWGLAGWAEGGRFITTAGQAGTTALRKPMKDLGYTFKYVVSLRSEPEPVPAILRYAEAARAAALLRGARIGMMGYRDMNLYGTLHDGVSLRAATPALSNASRPRPSPPLFLIMRPPPPRPGQQAAAGVSALPSPVPGSFARRANHRRNK